MRAGIDLLHALSRHEAQRGVAGRSDEIKAALVHQSDHFVRCSGRFDVDLTTGLLFEIRDPVVGFVALAALDVAGPRDDVDFALAFTDCPPQTTDWQAKWRKKTPIRS